MVLPRFCSFGAMRTLICLSISPTIGFVALILPMLWAQIAPNMEAVFFFEIQKALKNNIKKELRTQDYIVFP